MILSENSSTLGSRCCSAARSETEWQRNESWKVRLLKLPPKLNMQARASTAASGRAAGSERCTGGECGAVVAWRAVVAVAGSSWPRSGVWRCGAASAEALVLDVKLPCPRSSAPTHTGRMDKMTFEYYSWQRQGF